MHENVATRGADGFSDADFVGAFGNGNKHDIHHADAADHEGNRSDNSKHARNNCEKGASWVSDFVAVSHGKIFVAMFLSDESGFDIFGDFGKTIGVFGFDVDLLDLGGAGDFVERVDIHDESVVEVDVVEIDGFFDFV